MGMNGHGLAGLKTDQDSRPRVANVDLLGDKIFLRKLHFLKKMNWVHNLPPNINGKLEYRNAGILG
jgi:hypothetical protein